MTAVLRQVKSWFVLGNIPHFGLLLLCRCSAILASRHASPLCDRRGPTGILMGPSSPGTSRYLWYLVSPSLLDYCIFARTSLNLSNMK